jgi:hypothetical protein
MTNQKSTTETVSVFFAFNSHHFRNLRYLSHTISCHTERSEDRNKLLRKQIVLREPQHDKLLDL